MNKYFINHSCIHWLECRIHIHEAFIQSADIIWCTQELHFERNLWHPTNSWPQWRNISLRSSCCFPVLLDYISLGKELHLTFFSVACLLPQAPGIIHRYHIRIDRHRKKILIFTKTTVSTLLRNAEICTKYLCIK